MVDYSFTSGMSNAKKTTKKNNKTNKQTNKNKWTVTIKLN